MDPTTSCQHGIIPQESGLAGHAACLLCSAPVVCRPFPTIAPVRSDIVIPPVTECTVWQKNCDEAHCSLHTLYAHHGQGNSYVIMSFAKLYRKNSRHPRLLRSIEFQGTRSESLAVGTAKVMIIISGARSGGPRIRLGPRHPGIRLDEAQSQWMATTFCRRSTIGGPGDVCSCFRIRIRYSECPSFALGIRLSLACVVHLDSRLSLPQ